GLAVVELADYDLSTVMGVAAPELSFRGQVVGGADDQLDEQLTGEAYEDHDAARTADYGQRLLQAVLASLAAACPGLKGRPGEAGENSLELDEALAAVAARAGAAGLSKMGPPGSSERDRQRMTVGFGDPYGYRWELECRAPARQSKPPAKKPPAKKPPAKK